MEINLSIKITDTITPSELAQLHELIETAYKAVSINGIQLQLNTIEEITNE